MTNEARYKRAFSTLHASGNLMEVKTMNDTRKRVIPRLVAVCAAAALVLAMAGVAYAADVGGIQRTVQLWFYGDQTNAVLDIRGDEYTLVYTDSTGEVHERGGGGIVIGPDGSERPMTEEEFLEQLDQPEVEYSEDGPVAVWWRGRKLDITDRFEDSVCYVQLKDGGDTLYMTVKYNDSYATSPHSYPDPDTFSGG